MRNCNYRNAVPRCRLGYHAEHAAHVRIAVRIDADQVSCDRINDDQTNVANSDEFRFEVAE